MTRAFFGLGTLAFLAVSPASGQKTFVISSDSPKGSYRDGFVDSEDFQSASGSSLGDPDALEKGENGDTLSAGQFRNSSSGKSYSIARQSVLFFKLPDLQSKKLKKAQLRLYLANLSHEDPKLPPPGTVSLWHDVLQNSTPLEPTLAYAGTGQKKVGTLADGKSGNGTFCEVDVTSWITQDYDKDPAGSRVAFFRLQLDNVKDYASATGKNVYEFHGGQQQLFKPELVITTAP